VKKRLFQIGVLAVCGVLLLILYITAPWKSGAAEEGGVDTPVRVGQGEALVSVWGYTLEEAVEASDLVLDVTVTSWLGEDLSDIMSTFFEAKVNTILKGNAPDIITIKQNGNSQCTLRDFPLFQRGNRLIVFLKKGEEQIFDLDFDLDYDNAYWILSSYTTVLHVQTVDGKTYALDRYGMLTEEYFYDYGGLREQKDGLSKVSIKEASDFWKVMEAADPLITRSGNRKNILVRYDEFIGEIERFAGQQG